MSYLASDDDDVRVGISIPRKVGNAVSRNKIKRRVKASLRDIDVEVQPGRYGFLIYPEVARLNYHQIKEIVSSLMARAAQRMVSDNDIHGRTDKEPGR